MCTRSEALQVRSTPSMPRQVDSAGKPSNCCLFPRTTSDKRTRQRQHSSVPFWSSIALELSGVLTVYFTAIGKWFSLHRDIFEGTCIRSRSVRASGFAHHVSHLIHFEQRNQLNFHVYRGPQIRQSHPAFEYAEP